MHLFVYGTLRKGAGANGLLSDSEYIGTFEYDGAKMVSLGGFPGIKLGEDLGTIVGDVYKIPRQSIINACDQYEGYDERYPNESLYLRKSIVVNGIECYTYEFNQSIDDKTTVPGGDWLRRYA